MSKSFTMHKWMMSFFQAHINKKGYFSICPSLVVLTSLNTRQAFKCTTITGFKKVQACNSFNVHCSIFNTLIFWRLLCEVQPLKNMHDSSNKSHGNNFRFQSKYVMLWPLSLHFLFNLWCIFSPPHLHDIFFCEFAYRRCEVISPVLFV